MLHSDTTTTPRNDRARGAHLNQSPGDGTLHWNSQSFGLNPPPPSPRTVPDRPRGASGSCSSRARSHRPRTGTGAAAAWGDL